MMGKITFNATYKKGITGGGARLSAEDGWGDVVDLLLDGRDTPVVVSYSVTASFPDSDWEAGMDKLRATPFMEIDPGNWEGYYFGEGWDVKKLVQLLAMPDPHRQRVASAYAEDRDRSAPEAWAIASKNN